MKNDNDHIAKASVAIDAPVDKVWEALVNPAIIQQYMFGTTVKSSWKPGSPITWKGEWKGKSYEDKGEILEVVPEHHLKYSHYSPLTGEPDVPESYHHVTIDLIEEKDKVRVALSQDNNGNEEARAHSEKNWKTMLEGLKKVVES